MYYTVRDKKKYEELLDRRRELADVMFDWVLENKEYTGTISMLKKACWAAARCASNGAWSATANFTRRYNNNSWGFYTSCATALTWIKVAEKVGLVKRRDTTRNGSTSFMWQRCFTP